MIKLNHVTKRYGKSEVIKDLNLEIPNGKIVGYIGPNGAGKTTTLSMITGITNISEGEVTLNGVNIEKNPIEAKKLFGLVPDSPDVFLKFTPIQYFNFIADMYDVNKEDRNKRIEEFSERFEVKQYLNQAIEDLSHGTRQKIIIIGVLIHEPEIWILDEPMTGLDPNAAFTLKELMKEHAKKGKTVLFSTHVLEVAEKLCDEIIILTKGKVIYKGTYEKLLEKYPETNSLEELFLLITKGEKEE